VTAGRVVLVVGPRLAGVDGLVGALLGELPDHVVTGPDGLAGRVPDAVVGVVSAVAPLTRTDWDGIERAAAGVDLLIGAVSKIDAHRGWRAVADADRTLAAGWTARRRPVPWVGVAAKPDLGVSRVGDLVVLLRDELADPGLDRRNHLRRVELGTGVSRPPGPNPVALRAVVQRTRLRLLRSVRDGSSTLRAQLRDDASAVRAAGSGRFETAVRAEAARFLAGVDDEVTRAVDEAAAELGCGRPSATQQVDPPDLSRSPSSSRRLEGRLMAVLGVGFGLGIALASSRLLAGLARGPSLLGLAAGLAVGLALVVWVVRVRGLLHERALLDRWVNDVVATLRWHGEAMVAERLLAAESTWVRAPSRRLSDGVSRLPGSGLIQVTDQYEW
jgi:hypothetical protein